MSTKSSPDPVPYERSNGAQSNYGISNYSQATATSHIVHSLPHQTIHAEWDAQETSYFDEDDEACLQALSSENTSHQTMREIKAPQIDNPRFQEFPNEQWNPSQQSAHFNQQ